MQFYYATCSPTGKCTRYRSRYSSCRSLRDLFRHRGMSLAAWWVLHSCTNQNGDSSVCVLRLGNYSMCNYYTRMAQEDKCLCYNSIRGLCWTFVLLSCFIHSYSSYRRLIFTHTHLTHDKHVLAPNDALLHFGTDCLPQLHLIPITIGRVQVTVTSSDSCLGCTLTHFWACGLLIRS